MNQQLTPGSLRNKTVRWYSRHARDLPWRSGDATPWGIMVSEFMLQQTPVARVLPVWLDWMERYPTPADLAAVPSGEAIKAWGRLGYPRRALRLHGAAIALVRDHGGDVPSEFDTLLGLPGVGRYTAGAIASFAYNRAHPVLDINIRRVLGRVFDGRPEPTPAPSPAEYALATSLLPATGPAAARWNSAVMELGALVCTARAPLCGECPLRTDCAWVRAGRPVADSPARLRQAWHGTDRQLRGAVMAVLRADGGPIGIEHFLSEPDAVRGSAVRDGPQRNGTVLSIGQADALARLTDLKPDNARMLRLIDDLCADGLAESSDCLLMLPRN